MDNQEKYYIGKKQYIPGESYAICTVSRDNLFDIMADPERTVLYKTKKGAYFLVSSQKGVTNVKVLSEEEAFIFLDKNAAGIDTEVYNELLGEPEKG